jgi:hypothetical protein
MNTCLITGATLSALISVAHSYFGERFILTRLLRRTELPHLFGSDRFTRQTLRFTWHLSSVAWLGLAGVLISFTYANPIQTRAFTLQVISLTFLMNAIITFLATRGRYLAWIIFLGIAFVAWLGVG